MKIFKIKKQTCLKCIHFKTTFFPDDNIYCEKNHVGIRYNKPNNCKDYLHL